MLTNEALSGNGDCCTLPGGGIDVEPSFSYASASESPGGLVTTQTAGPHPELMIQLVFVRPGHWHF